VILTPVISLDSQLLLFSALPRTHSEAKDLPRMPRAKRGSSSSSKANPAHEDAVVLDHSDEAGSGDDGDSDFAPRSEPVQSSSSAESADKPKLPKGPSRPSTLSPAKRKPKRSRDSDPEPSPTSTKGSDVGEAAPLEDDATQGISFLGEEDDVDDLGGERIIAPADPPPDLTLTLLPFQKESLSWMCEQEHSAYRGGILADEMVSGCDERSICSTREPWPCRGWARRSRRLR
jgi:SNF2 family DNA or RNA helicase